MHCPACHQPAIAGDRFCGHCGGVLAPTPGLLAPGALVAGDRLRIEEQLGEGGMGAVYRTTDLRLQRASALKILHPELVAHPTARRRMEQEALALARVDHPNVVQLRNVFDHAGCLMLELELVTGGTLAHRIGASGMAEAETVRLMVGVLSGLAALHEAGLVHRDLKPENVLMTADNRPKLTDLGVARDAAARERTQLGVVLGTAAYMAPEQIQGQQVDARADIYAAGLVLFEMLCGVSPYVATTDFEWSAAHIQQQPRLDLLRGRASPPLRMVIAKALAKSPSDRYPSAHAMRAAIEAAVAQAQVPPPRPEQATSVVRSPFAVPDDAAGRAGSLARGKRDTQAIELLGIDEVNFGQLFSPGLGSHVVGRGNDAALRLGGDGVSRRHALLVVRADGKWLSDLESVNGVSVNNVKLMSPCRLAAGDTITLGRAVLRVL